MIDTKYRDRSFLSKYDLDVDMFKKFNLVVNDVIPIRKVYIVSTNKGDKILKRIEYPIEELLFIQDAIKYIKRSFNRIMDFVETDKGNIYVNWKGNTYCIMDLVEGRECEYTNPLDVSTASKALGKLHIAAEGFSHSLKSKNVSGTIIDVFSRKYHEIKFFKSIANIYENKTEFDTLFLKNVDYYMSQALNSIELLKKSQYYKLCSEENKVVLCHHDLAHHNILIKNNEAYFIDFDYSIIDLKVHDLCNFINKVLKDSFFDYEMAENILKNYCTTNTIDTRELQVLNAMLVFPEDFYSVTKDYYTRRKDWSEEMFLYKLNKKVNSEEDRQEFLEDFKKHTS